MAYFDGPTEMVHKVNEWCRVNIEKYKAKSLFLPAGKTPEPVYHNWEADRPDWLEQLELMQVDDVYNGVKKGMFKKFFEQQLPSYAGRIMTPAQSGGRAADLAILGVGKNGHVAFHEPGLPESFFYGVIDLSGSTKSYLELEPEAKGVTYGVGAFLQAKAILLIATGEGKHQVLNEFLAGKSQLPIGFLTKHPDLTVLIDEKMMPEIKDLGATPVTMSL